MEAEIQKIWNESRFSPPRKLTATDMNDKYYIVLEDTKSIFMVMLLVKEEGKIRGAVHMIEAKYCEEKKDKWYITKPKKLKFVECREGASYLTDRHEFGSNKLMKIFDDI